MDDIKIVLSGVAPLIMHSSAMVDKSNPIVREIAKITSKGSRKQTDADIERIAELEFLGGMWRFNGQPAVPTQALEACFRDGAKASRRGKDADRSAFVDGEAIPLTFDGPKDPEKLWEKRATYALTVAVGIQKARVMRTRPIFRKWSVEFSMFFDSSAFNLSDLKEAWIEAGRRGLGEWRPKYGRFNVAFS